MKTKIKAVGKSCHKALVHNHTHSALHPHEQKTFWTMGIPVKDADIELIYFFQNTIPKVS